ncbi:MAG: hypothetical protein ABGY95_02435, partial [Rubritalea sp.]|uniref:hypothetical protein n=1 Tax=Rubritalea sp. TaxID=2109375 RepID=UPI00324287FD
RKAILRAGQPDDFSVDCQSSFRQDISNLHIGIMEDISAITMGWMPLHSKQLKQIPISSRCVL